MARLPYRAVRCEHCTSDDLTCEFCDGTHRVIEHIRDKQRVAEALDNWLKAARGTLRALKGMGVK